VIELELRPDRGLDVVSARLRGMAIGRRSPGEEPGVVGLVSTCGLDHVGARSKGLPQDGTYSLLPARDVHRGEGEARGTVEDPRRLRAEGRLPFLEPGEERRSTLELTVEEET